MASLTLRAAVALLVVCAAHGYSFAKPENQTAEQGFRFLPGRVLLAPLTANLQEPRVGVRKELATSRLKLDIGSSVDLLEYAARNDSSRFRFGAELFTYALTTNSEGLRLQVDAVDGFFGGHIVYCSDQPQSRFALRLRLMHLSAHFLDGHYYAAEGRWKDNRDPLPFTRDFGELAAFWTVRGAGWSATAYTGFSYATLVRPVNIKRVMTLHGVEAHSEAIAGPVFGKPFNLYAGDHVSFAGIPAYIATNNLEAGVKFGAWDATGVRLYVSYYNGLDIFSQYYDVRRDMWSAGFTIDFW